MQKIIKFSLITFILNIALLANESKIGVSDLTLNVRNAPSLDSKVIGYLQKSRKIIILETVQAKNGYFWYKTPEGYVSESLVKLIPIKTEHKNTENIEVAESKPTEVKTKSIKTETSELKSTNHFNIIKSNLFVSISAGYSFMSVKQENSTGNLLLSRPTSYEGENITIALGYKHLSGNVGTFSATYVHYNDVNFYNYLISYNKVFDYDYSPYIGLVGGVSFVELTQSHLGGSLADSGGSAFAYGVQFGADKKIDDHISIFAQYQFLKAEHTTELQTTSASSKLTRDNQAKINIGLRYFF
ncbi:MAG: SH3 domain-containing protein [Helicobacteraceae bacterium]|nr:SH3 domain-containing protein [Helicobacteraceae bacterium]